MSNWNDDEFEPREGYGAHTDACTTMWADASQCVCGLAIREADRQKKMMDKLMIQPLTILPGEIQEELVRIAKHETAKRIMAERQAASEPGIKLTSRQDRADRKPISWMVGGLVPAGGSLGIIYGIQGSNKTFLVLDLALTILNRGRTWMGRATNFDGVGDSVIYVLGEGALGFPGREAAWLARYGGQADNLYTIESQDVALDTDAGLDRLRQAILGTGQRPALIVFDTQGLSAAGGVDENSRTDIRAVYARAKALAAEFGALVLMVTHPGNDPKTWNRPAGASTQAQDADLMLHVSWSDKKKLGKVTVRKVKEGEAGWAWQYGRQNSLESIVLFYGGPADAAKVEGQDDDDDDNHHGSSGGGGTPSEEVNLISVSDMEAVEAAIEAEPGITQRGLSDATALHPDKIRPVIAWLLDTEHDGAAARIRIESGMRRATHHYLIDQE